MTPLDDEKLVGDLMTALDVAVFDVEGRKLRLLGQPPGWFRSFFSQPSEIIDPNDGLIFLESFLVDAERAWEEGPGRVAKSGVWSEEDREGNHCHLTATALRLGVRQILLVELLGIEYEERRAELQRAREGKLDSYRELLDQQRETRSLSDRRDELEIEVRRRTRELSEANELLRLEIERRRELEERANRLRSELAHADRLDTMGEMAATMAHELNQPLGAVINYMKGCLRILDGVDPDLQRVRDALAKTSAQAERAGSIVSSLRGLGAKGDDARTRCDLGQLLREVVELLEFERRRSGVELRLNCALRLPTVVVNRVQTQQVLLNLVKNAIEAASAPGARQALVHVETEALGSRHVRVTVRDGGAGYAGDLEKLFEPYFSTKREGMGMGLAICRSIAEAHAGSLAVSREPNGGLRFEFVLPRDVQETHS
jgi:C4-dicarboxylate-specific signal transduction histidine kinase